MPEKQKLDILDGLRGIAILFVFWHHLYQENVTKVYLGLFTIDLTSIVATGGSYGVDLFFFLSGFCLFYPYARALFDGVPFPTLGHFAYQRAIKILPSYAIAIAGMIWIHQIVLPASGNLYGHVLLHLFFIHTLFDESFSSINPVFWSLGLEIQFYLIFPLIARCMLRGALGMTLLTLTFAAVGRVYVMNHPGSAPGWPGHQLATEIDPFVTGMFTAYLFRALTTRHQALVHPRRAWAWTLLAALGVGLYLFTASLVYHVHDPAFERYMLLPLDIAFFAVTLGSLFGAAHWQAAIGDPVLAFYARISYNLYLWHTVLRDELFQHRVLPLSLDDPRYLFFLALLSLLCATAFATLLTYGIERPLMRLRPFARKHAAA
jgi:peptidoglycan/LPS O-acetylase OafA/YrhL